MDRPANKKPVYGVGINDASYQVCAYETIAGRQKQLWRCPFYKVWTSMLSRCYSIRFQSINQTYIGCTVCPEWLSFSIFREWMASQPWEENQLDKDVLVPGNKVYSPITCVFLPRHLNLFMTDSEAARGEWPIGVSWYKPRGKLRATCCNPFTGVNEYLGLFTCPDVAREAWRKRKHEHALRYADLQTDPRIAAALRSRYAKGYES